MRLAIIGNDGCNSCSRTLLERARERFARCSPKVECFHCTLSEFKKIAFSKKKNMPWSRFNQAFEHQILDCHKFTNHPVVLSVERWLHGSRRCEAKSLLDPGDEVKSDKYTKLRDCSVVPPTQISPCVLRPLLCLPR